MLRNPCEEVPLQLIFRKKWMEGPVILMIRKRSFKFRLIMKKIKRIFFFDKVQDIDNRILQQKFIISSKYCYIFVVLVIQSLCWSHVLLLNVSFNVQILWYWSDILLINTDKIFNPYCVISNYRIIWLYTSCFLISDLFFYVIYIVHTIKLKIKINQVDEHRWCWYLSFSGFLRLVLSPSDYKNRCFLITICFQIQ